MKFLLKMSPNLLAQNLSQNLSVLSNEPGIPSMQLSFLIVLILALTNLLLGLIYAYLQYRHKRQRRGGNGDSSSSFSSSIYPPRRHSSLSGTHRRSSGPSVCGGFGTRSDSAGSRRKKRRRKTSANIVLNAGGRCTRGKMTARRTKSNIVWK